MKKVAIVVGAVLVLVLGFMGFQMMKAQGKAKEEADKAKANQYTVKRGDITNRVVETGAIDAVKVVEVKSRVSGRVKKLLVDAGDMVTAGQLIAVIDPREIQLQVNQSRAQLRGAQANVSRTGIEIEQRRVNAAASLSQARTRLAQIQSELRIQPTLTQSSIRQAKAGLDSAKAEIERLRGVSQPNNRLAAENAVKEAQASYDNVLAEHRRQESLYRDGFVALKVVEGNLLQVRLAELKLQQAKDSFNRIDSQLRIEMSRAQDDLRRAQAAYDSALANSIQDVQKRREYESAVADVEKARIALRDVDVLLQSKISSEASVDQIRSQLDDTLRNLGETEIRAPMSGIVSAKLVQEGELVAGLSTFNSGTPIVKIENRNVLRVKLSINEIDTAKLEKGLTAKVTVDALPGKEFEGEVRKIAPSSVAASAAGAASFNTETVVKYEVEVYLTSTDSRLRSGMSARCDLPVETKKGVVLVPLQYLGKEKDGTHFVNVAPVTKSDKPTKKKVKIGIQTGANAEILDGVKEGDVLARPDFTGPDRKGMIMAGPEDEEQH